MFGHRDPKAYENRAFNKAMAWRNSQLSAAQKASGGAQAAQDQVNEMIPEPVHKVVTGAVKQLTRAIMTGSGWITAKPRLLGNLAEREASVRRRMRFYRRLASVEGGVTGAGGLLLRSADIPALMAIKIKLLFDLCALYGYDSRDPRERLFILRIFQMAFASEAHKAEALEALEQALPDARQPVRDADFDWRRFQQDYRDRLDLAKMGQMVPILGAPVGVVVNWRMTQHLANTAIQAYRLRWFKEKTPS